MADKRDEGKYWLKRANNALSASEALVSEELFDDAISRAYYAMFYAAKALLIRDGVAAGSKHSAVVAAFGREYAKSGKVEPRYHQMLIEDFEWRQKADYDVFWHADRDTAQGLRLTRLVSVGFVIYYRRMEFPIVDLARMQNVSVGLSRKMALKSP